MIPPDVESVWKDVCVRTAKKHARVDLPPKLNNRFQECTYNFALTKTSAMIEDLVEKVLSQVVFFLGSPEQQQATAVNLELYYNRYLF